MVLDARCTYSQLRKCLCLLVLTFFNYYTRNAPKQQEKEAGVLSFTVVPFTLSLQTQKRNPCIQDLF